MSAAWRVVAPVLLVIARWHPAIAAPGGLDPAFGTSGEVVTYVGTRGAAASALAIQGDGKIVAVGSAVAPLGWSLLGLVRYLPDGRLDPSFGWGGVVESTVDAGFDFRLSFADAIVLPDGKILTGCGSSRGTFMVVRHLADGRLDTSFGERGIASMLVGTSSTCSGMVVQPDGRILLAGSYSVGGPSIGAIVRLHPDGRPDESFGRGGVVDVVLSGNWHEHLRDIALQADGRIVVVGPAFLVPTGDDFAVARLLADGTPDPSFGADGSGRAYCAITSRDDLPIRLAIAPDGAIVVTGMVSNGTPLSVGVARFASDGAVDSGFGDAGHTVLSIPDRWLGVGGHALGVQGDGRIVVAAGLWDGMTISEAVARLDADGSLDPSFGGGLVVRGDAERRWPAALAIQSDGDVLVAGELNYDFYVARFLADDCGDGVLDDGESCDDGNRQSGDCCSSTCFVEPRSTVCRAPVGPCDVPETCDGMSAHCPADEMATAGTVCREIRDACDVVEVCDGVMMSCPEDETAPDGDGDGVCDAEDPCISGVVVEKASLRLSNFKTAPGDDRIDFKGRLVLDPHARIDPVASGLRLLVTDADSRFRIDVTVPAGPYSPTTRSGWKRSARGDRFSFVAPSGLVDRVAIRRRSTGRLDITVRGKGASFASPPVALPLEMTVVLSPPTIDGGQCAEIPFHGPPPRSGCWMAGAGAVLVCR